MKLDNFTKFKIFLILLEDGTLECMMAIINDDDNSEDKNDWIY